MVTCGAGISLHIVGVPTIIGNLALLLERVSLPITFCWVLKKNCNNNWLDQTGLSFYYVKGLA